MGSWVVSACTADERRSDYLVTHVIMASQKNVLFVHVMLQPNLTFYLGFCRSFPMWQPRLQPQQLDGHLPSCTRHCKRSSPGFPRGQNSYGPAASELLVEWSCKRQAHFRACGETQGGKASHNLCMHAVMPCVAAGESQIDKFPETCCVSAKI